MVIRCRAISSRVWLTAWLTVVWSTPERGASDGGQAEAQVQERGQDLAGGVEPGRARRGAQRGGQGVQVAPGQAGQRGIGQGGQVPADRGSGPGGRVVAGRGRGGPRAAGRRV